MTTQLPERLRELADDAPAALSAGDMWRTGRRRHRVRAAAALGTSACLVLVAAVLGTGDWRSHQPGPAAPPATNTGPMGIPSPLFNPNPWVSGTSAPGRLVALMGTTRDHFPLGSDKNALVGVSAGSQAYHFLDLPGQARDDHDAALSPDGLHLAYWVDGDTSDGAPLLGVGSIAGVAVLDLVSGVAEQHVVFTQHGLAAGMLSWVDSSTVAVTANLLTSSDPASYGRTRSYEFTLGETNGYSSVTAPVRQVPVTSTQGYAAMVGARTLRIWSSTDDRSTDLRLSEPIRAGALVGQRGRLAAVAGNPNADGPTSGALVVGRIAEGEVRLESVPGGRRYAGVLTWVDNHHVATERQTRQGIVYDVVDVRTGARRELTRKPWYAFTIAQDALHTASTVPGIAPPRPWNPRWVVGGSLAALLLAGAGLLLVVRSRRVRR